MCRLFVVGILPEIHYQREQLQPDRDESRIWDDWAAADGGDHPASSDASPSSSLWTSAAVRHSQLYDICFNLPLYYSPEGFRVISGFTLWAQRMAFTRLAITLPEVNRLGWNLEHREPNVGGWPGQTLGAIGTVVKVWEGAEILFFCHANNARFSWFPVGQSLRHFNTTTSIGVAM